MTPGKERLLLFLTQRASSIPTGQITFLVEGLSTLIQRKLTRAQQLAYEESALGQFSPAVLDAKAKREKVTAQLHQSLLDLVPFSGFDAAQTLLSGLWFQSGGKFKFRFAETVAAAASFLAAASKAQVRSFYKSEDSAIELVQTYNPSQIRAQIELETKIGRSPSSIMWVKMLMQVPGISEAKAIAFVEKYPTVHSIMKLAATCDPSTAAKAAAGKKAAVPMTPMERKIDMVGSILANAPMDTGRLGPALGKKIATMLLCNDPTVAPG